MVIYKSYNHSGDTDQYVSHNYLKYTIFVLRTVYTIPEFVEIRAIGSTVFRTVYLNHWKNMIFEKNKKS